MTAQADIFATLDPGYKAFTEGDSRLIMFPTKKAPSADSESLIGLQESAPTARRTSILGTRPPRPHPDNSARKSYLLFESLNHQDINVRLYAYCYMPTAP